MEKHYRVYVTNIDAALTVLRELGIAASTNGTGVSFTLAETKKMDVIVALNSAKVVVYDIEEV